MDEKVQIEEMSKTICSHYEPNHLGCGRCPDCWARDEAKKLHAAGYRKQSEDTVEVVRCKDCINRVEFDTNKYHCELTGYYCGEMGYCSDGVRKNVKGGAE